MTRRAGFTILEMLVVTAIIALMVALLLPALSKARELARQMAEENVMEQAAEQAEDLDLDSRIAALAGQMHEGAAAEGNDLTRRVGVLQIDGHKFRVEADTRGEGDERIVDRVAVRIDSKVVYERTVEFLDGVSPQMGEIGFYRGMGEWEHMLDEAERLVGENTRLAREAKFKTDLEKRYGPLPGFGAVE